MKKPRKRSPRKAKRASTVAKQNQALGLLLAGMTQREASKEINVHEATLSGWLQDTDLRARLDKAFADRHDAVMAKIGAKAPAAVDTLVTLMESKLPAEAPTRARAAIALLDRAGATARTGLDIKVTGKVETEPTEELVDKLRDALNQGGED